MPGHSNCTMIKFNRSPLAALLNLSIALVWLINGLFCKVLGFVPRHEMIVARILGNEDAYSLTKIIGGLEILMAIWVVSRIAPKLCITTQVLLVATMNIIEYNRAPDLLLFGNYNIVVAC